ncbi:hypothetical protein C3400_31155 [Klebsiella oxytoca]|nr:hypothetical protein AM364_28105 [Klebsiella pneumoniae]POT63483.1 hypothetical protein C3412_26020 [Klebsiella oxytoca]RNT33136.1 hypothetical protein B9037_008475 [Klebsiella aerogenes]AUU98682.1 hypothetical protein C2U49_28780 [Klebsiella pneumoniae]POU90764.1 hypothetical protein C3400_31155 [Klebsiella oxytoca]
MHSTNTRDMLQKTEINYFNGENMGYPVLLIIKTILQECTAHFIISYFKDRQREMRPFRKQGWGGILI